MNCDGMVPRTKETHVITHQGGNGDDFDLGEAVDDILSLAGHYADEQGNCPHVLCELLAMAAAKARILTHYQEEHGEDE